MPATSTVPKYLILLTHGMGTSSNSIWLIAVFHLDPTAMHIDFLQLKMISCTLPYSEHMLNMDSNVTTDADSSICRPTNYELLRWLVETPSRDFEHYRMTDDSRQSIIQHFHVRWKCRKIDRPTFSRYVKCRVIGFARWRFNLFECRRRMLQRHLPNGVERTQLRSPDCW